MIFASAAIVTNRVFVEFRITVCPLWWRFLSCTLLHRMQIMNASVRIHTRFAIWVLSPEVRARWYAVMPQTQSGACQFAINISLRYIWNVVCTYQHMNPITEQQPSSFHTMRQIVEVSTSDFSSRRLSRFLPQNNHWWWLAAAAGGCHRKNFTMEWGRERGRRTYLLRS